MAIMTVVIIQTRKTAKVRDITRDIFFPVVFGTFAKISFDIQYKNNSNEDYL